MAVVITQAGIAIPNGTIIRVTNFCYQNGQMAMPSVHYQMTSPGGVGIFNLGDAAFSFQTNFASAAKARLSTGVVLTGTKAAIVSLVMILVLLFAGVLQYVMLDVSGTMRDMFGYFSAIEHMETFSKGIIDTRPIVWYLPMTTFVLVLTYQVFQSRKWRM